MVNATYRPAPPRAIVGVDFSGAAKSGKTAWIADFAVCDEDVADGGGRVELTSLGPIGRFAGSDDRADVCGYLVDRIRTADQTLFGMDFPFGLPIELGLGDWPDQLSHVAQFDGDAKDFGRSLVERSKRLGQTMHIRRDTDRETQTPFDCYHYRIIYQTFHGMRDVLSPVAGDPMTCVLPFQYPKWKSSNRNVVEACPSSTLKRLNLPHQKYKQSAGKPPDEVHKKTRRVILKGIGVGSNVIISPHHRRIIMNDSGGDALDAVLAAIGSLHDYQNQDHQKLAHHPRYPQEGRVYA